MKNTVGDIDKCAFCENEAEYMMINETSEKTAYFVCIFHKEKGK